MFELHVSQDIDSVSNNVRVDDSMMVATHDHEVSEALAFSLALSGVVPWSAGLVRAYMTYVRDRVSGRIN
jgi:hypothetical protein